VSSATTLVAVSAVQSADGRLVDLDRLEQACAVTGTRVLLDTTQAVGWLPIDASRFAYTVCGGYKWLLAPRGTAYLTVQGELLDSLVPHTAGWYAGARPWESIYGGPLRLAPDARRFDVSPAWHAWIGAAPSLELLAGIGVPALHAHAVGLADEFRAGTGLPSGNSAIVSAIAEPEVPELMQTDHRIGSRRAAASVLPRVHHPPRRRPGRRRPLRPPPPMTSSGHAHPRARCGIVCEMCAAYDAAVGAAQKKRLTPLAGLRGLINVWTLPSGWRLLRAPLGAWPRRPGQRSAQARVR